MSLDPKRVRKFVCIYRVSGSALNDGFDFFMVCGSGDFALSSGSGVVAAQTTGRLTKLGGHGFASFRLTGKPVLEMRGTEDRIVARSEASVV